MHAKIYEYLKVDEYEAKSYYKAIDFAMLYGHEECVFAL